MALEGQLVDTCTCTALSSLTRLSLICNKNKKLISHLSLCFDCVLRKLYTETSIGAYYLILTKFAK